MESLRHSNDRDAVLEIQILALLRARGRLTLEELFDLTEVGAGAIKLTVAHLVESNQVRRDGVSWAAQLELWED